MALGLHKCCWSSACWSLAGALLLASGCSLAPRRRQVMPAVLTPVPYRQISMGAATRPPQPPQYVLPAFPDGAVLFVAGANNGAEMFFDTGAAPVRIGLHQPVAASQTSHVRATSAVGVPESANAVSSLRHGGELQPTRDAGTLAVASARGQLESQAADAELLETAEHGALQTRQASAAVTAPLAVDAALDQPRQSAQLLAAPGQDGHLSLRRYQAQLGQANPQTGRVLPQAATVRLAEQHANIGLAPSATAVMRTSAVASEAAVASVREQLELPPRRQAQVQVQADSQASVTQSIQTTAVAASTELVTTVAASAVAPRTTIASPEPARPDTVATPAVISATAGSVRPLPRAASVPQPSERVRALLQLSQAPSAASAAQFAAEGLYEQQQIIAIDASAVELATANRSTKTLPRRQAGAELSQPALHNAALTSARQAAAVNLPPAQHRVAASSTGEAVLASPTPHWVTAASSTGAATLTSPVGLQSTLASNAEAVALLPLPAPQNTATASAVLQQNVPIRTASGGLAAAPPGRGALGLPPPVSSPAAALAASAHVALPSDQTALDSASLTAQVHTAAVATALLSQAQTNVTTATPTAAYALRAVARTGSEAASPVAASAAVNGAAAAASGAQAAQVPDLTQARKPAKSLAAAPRRVASPRQSLELPPVQGQPFFGLDAWQLGESIRAYNLRSGFVADDGNRASNDIAYIPARSAGKLEQALPRGQIRELLYDNRWFGGDLEPARLDQALRIHFPDYQQNLCHGAEFVAGVEVTNRSSSSFDRSLLCLRLPAHTDFVAFTAEPSRLDGFVQVHAAAQRMLIWKLYQPLEPGQRFQAYFRLRAQAWPGPRR